MKQKFRFEKGRIFLFSALLLAMAAATTACNNEQETSRVISPETNLNEDLISFFDAELPFMENSKGFFTLDPPNKDVCYIVNKDNEFRDLYLGEKPLPSIDFTRYTLIMGKVQMQSSFYYVAKQNISISEKMVVVNLFVSPFSEDGSWPAFSTLYFWGLYPKFSAENISVNTIEDGNTIENIDQKKN